MNYKKNFRLLESYFNELRRRRDRNILNGDDAAACLEHIDYLERYIEEQNSQVEEACKMTRKQVERANSLEAQLRKIANETNCDDTHEYINRLLKGDASGALSYRINQEEKLK